MSPIQTITILRAGTMLSWEILGLNFVGVPTGKGSIRQHHTHMIIKDAKKYHWYDKLKGGKKPTIYILRDIRDVLTSQFHFMVGLNIDFKGFLRGKANPVSMIRRSEVGVIATPAHLYPCIQERIRPHPIQAWVEHSRWIDEEWVDFYKFEDIVKDQAQFVIWLVEKYNLKLKKSAIKTVDKLVGVKPRKGIVGDWETHFDDDDLKYLWDIAGNRMKELGYGK